MTVTNDGGEWLEVDEACELLRIGPVRLARLLDAGELRAEEVPGRVVISRASVGARMALYPPQPRRRRKQRPVAAVELVPVPSPEPEPSPSAEVLAQAALLGKFLQAADEGRPGPCPVCGDTLRPSEWPAHLLGHR